MSYELDLMAAIAALEKRIDRLERVENQKIVPLVQVVRVLDDLTNPRAAGTVSTITIAGATFAVAAPYNANYTFPAKVKGVWYSGTVVATAAQNNNGFIVQDPDYQFNATSVAAPSTVAGHVTTGQGFTTLSTAGALRISNLQPVSRLVLDIWAYLL